MDCTFCKPKNDIYATVIEDTKYFNIKPSKGSIVPNYLLIISKRHITSFADLNKEEQKEFLMLIDKYRKLFYEKTSKYPIIFEHGTKDNNSSSSVVHAHVHIASHNYLNEKCIIKRLNLEKNDLKNLFISNLDKSYILYINEKNEVYISYNYKKESQIMRKFIAKDINEKYKWNWKRYPFTKNVKVTIKTFKN